MVPLQIVSNVSRFKLALNLNRVLADLSRGSNSLNSASLLWKALSAIVQYLYYNNCVHEKMPHELKTIKSRHLILIFIWTLCIYSRYTLTYTPHAPLALYLLYWFIMFLKPSLLIQNIVKAKNWGFTTNSDFLVPISLQATVSNVYTIRFQLLLSSLRDGGIRQKKLLL